MKRSYLVSYNAEEEKCSNLCGLYAVKEEKSRERKYEEEAEMKRSVAREIWPIHAAI